MKSLKVKKIILKNPRLRTIRRNLRIVLKLAVRSERERLGRIEDLYIKKRTRQNLMPSQRKREISLSRMGDALLARIGSSTCQCSSGGYCLSHQELVEKGLVKPSELSPDLDLVWIPWYKKMGLREMLRRVLQGRDVRRVCREPFDALLRI